ncbi:hypothetical protein [Mucilaginibacter psychrotolerans]|uniref:hypothetical protein n=1 Tax=Mucilaginibacter psychrotolerans TaxID=1524096 RepID=UPI00130544F5|nr:hypothetical protein [Mucilaginibacter psychrotolerans]
MTADELRKEIHAPIDKLPENRLHEILDYINKIERARPREFFEETIKEDYEVFKRLAE